jgi:hypothetical protein
MQSPCLIWKVLSGCTLSVGYPSQNSHQPHLTLRSYCASTYNILQHNLMLSYFSRLDGLAQELSHTFPLSLIKICFFWQEWAGRFPTTESWNAYLGLIIQSVSFTCFIKGTKSCFSMLHPHPLLACSQWKNLWHAVLTDVAWATAFSGQVWWYLCLYIL